MQTLIVGCGYVGKALGEQLARQGHKVFGLKRTDDDQKELKSVGIVPLKGDVTKRADLEKLPAEYDWVLNCVSSSRGDADDYRAVYLEGTRNLLEWLSGSPLKKFVYTSSTSAYAQTDGSIVTELSPADPTAETARILVKTERLLLQATERKYPAVILRVGGIYGPGRGYWFKQFLKGEAKIEGKGERYLNMVHREDVVGAVIAALEKGDVGKIYNVVDDEPVRQLDFFQWLSNHSGKEMPPFVEGGEQAERKRGWTNKRISNARLKSELGYQFKYPSFREGWEAI